MDMWMHHHRSHIRNSATLNDDFCPAEPELRRKHAQLCHAIPGGMHIAECCPKIFNTAIFDCECQKERLMCREVLVELRKSLKEAPPPGPGASPLAEGADALVAYVSRP